MKKIFKVFMIVLQISLATAGLIELIHYLNGSGSTMSPYFTCRSAVVFYLWGIRNILTFNKENE